MSHCPGCAKLEEELRVVREAMRSTGAMLDEAREELKEARAYAEELEEENSMLGGRI